MNIIIKINIDNAAFENPGYEVARILRNLASRIVDNQEFPSRLQDINGNTVGHITIK